MLNNILACLIIFWERFLLIKHIPLTKKLWSLSLYRIYTIPHQGNSLQYDFTTKVQGTKAEVPANHMCVGDVALPTIPHSLPAK